jgi:hypothetical protein
LLKLFSELCGSLVLVFTACFCNNYYNFIAEFYLAQNTAVFHKGAVCTDLTATAYMGLFCHPHMPAACQRAYSAGQRPRRRTNATE